MPPRDSRTVSDVRSQKRASVAGKWLRAHQQAAHPKKRAPEVVRRKKEAAKRAPAPVVGENARDKARTPVVQAARETVDQIIKGQPPKVAAAKLASLNLSKAEKRDLGRYSKVRSTQATDAAFSKLTRGTAHLADEAVGGIVGVKPSDALWSVTHPRARVMSRGRAADPTPGTAFPGFGIGRIGKGLERIAARAAKPGVERAAAKAAAKTTSPPAAPTKLRPPAAASPGTVVATKGRTGDLLPPQASTVIAALPRAKALRLKQEQLYSAERGRRAGKAEQAMQVGGRAGYHAALHELKGELPKLKFGALEHFDQQAADELFTHVQQHPDLRPYEKIGTQTALTKVLGGAVPTRGEIKLLHRTFGPEIATQIAESIPFWAKARDRGIQILNVPRSLMASMDLSAPFRQGLVLGARHPKMFAKEFAPMLKSFKSEHAYEGVMDEIASRPTFETMQKSGLKLTDLQGLADREEQFMSNLAETITGGKHSPVRMSGRAYTGFLNKFRADAFDNYLTLIEQPHRTFIGRKRPGIDVRDPANEKAVKDIARWVNTATGRGSIKSLEGAMVSLNTLLFSPRLIASRLQLLNPVFYAKLDPFARKQALQGMAQLAGAMSLTLYLAKQAGAEVVMDPRSSDFGKIKVGDTRVDIGGGLLQYVVAASRIGTGETISSTTGETRKLQGGIGNTSRWDIGGKFLQNKFAPVPAFGARWLQGENFAGQPFDPVTEGAKLFVPLGAEQAYEARKNPGAAGVSFGLNAFGFGTQTYGPGTPKSTSKSLRGGSGATGHSKSLRSGSHGKSHSLRG